jgi:thioredoxin 1
MIREFGENEVLVDVVKEGTVLVDFYAEWCGPCRMMLPVLDQVDAELENVTIIKVDTDSHQELTASMNISGIPAFILYKDGAEIDRFGVTPKHALIGKLS